MKQKHIKQTKYTEISTNKHLDGVIRRSFLQDYCLSDLDIVGIIDQADEKLFQLVLTNTNHVFSSLLCDKTDQHYHLRAIIGRQSQGSIIRGFVNQKCVPYSQRYLFNAIPDTNHNANPTNPNRYSKGNPNPTNPTNPNTRYRIIEPSDYWTLVLLSIHYPQGKMPRQTTCWHT